MVEMEKFSVKPCGINFYKFYKKFKRVEDLMGTLEWEQTFKHYYEFSKEEEKIKPNETLDEMNRYDDATIKNELRKCYNDFYYFTHKYLKIMHPMEGLLPAVLYKYQKRVIKSYENNRFNIISKFRQGGLTTITNLWALWRCLFKNDQQIMFVSKTDREAKAAAMHINTAVENLPVWLKPDLGKWNEHEKQFVDTNSNLWFYAPDAARGKSITLLIIDEAAFIDGMERHWKSLYPVISTGGQCIVVSTVNGLGNWYEIQYHKAKERKNQFNVIDLDFWEHPDYNSPEWELVTKANVGERAWNQEYERSFLGSGQTFIPPHIVLDITNFTKNNTPLRFAFNQWANKTTDERPDFDEGAMWIWKEPADGHEYIIGVDVAEGLGENNDNSCFQIIDSGTLEQVAEFYSNEIPPYIYAQIVHAMGHYYNTALVVVEADSHGHTVLNELSHNELAYENLYYDTSSNKPGVKSSKTRRPQFIEALQKRLLSATVKINSKRFAHELNTFIWNTTSKRAEAAKDKHDDSILAMALALYIRDAEMRGIPVGAETPQEMTKSLKTSIYEEIKREILSGTEEEWMEDSPVELINSNDDDLPLWIKTRKGMSKILEEFNW